MSTILKPKCDMLIDQNLYIGDDPVGHVCLNDAEYQAHGYFFCQECRDMLWEGTERIRFPPVGSVQRWESGEMLKCIGLHNFER